MGNHIPMCICTVNILANLNSCQNIHFSCILTKNLTFCLSEKFEAKSWLTTRLHFEIILHKLMYPCST